MKVEDFLKDYAHPGMYNVGGNMVQVYLSNFDDTYLTHVGKEEAVRFLADREITEELSNGVGFSPKEIKWYGWSHRAIYGFGIGSTCKKGDCHYRAANVEEEMENAVLFWREDNRKDVSVNKVKDGELWVSWSYSDTMEAGKFRGQIGGVDWQYDPNNFGRGEWVAETMRDAKQMAIDFNEGVS